MDLNRAAVALVLHGSRDAFPFLKMSCPILAGHRGNTIRSLALSMWQCAASHPRANSQKLSVPAMPW